MQSETFYKMTKYKVYIIVFNKAVKVNCALGLQGKRRADKTPRKKTLASLTFSKQLIFQVNFYIYTIISHAASVK